MTAPADRTAACASTTAEREKAGRRAGLTCEGRRQAPETSRERLRRSVRVAAVQARDPESFFHRLRELGVLVRPRVTPPGDLVGYAVAARGDVDADGQPVWFGGRRLAHDLSLPALCARWQSAAAPDQPATEASVEVSVGWVEPAAAIATATLAVEQATVALRDGDAGVGSWIAHATADLLIALCKATENGSDPLPGEVADQFDRAARTPHLRHLARQPGRCAPAARELRRAAWRLAALRLPVRGGDDVSASELLAAVAVLVAEIAAYHKERQHFAQAAAARRACAVLPRPRRRVGPDQGGNPREAAAHPTSIASRVLLRPTSGGRPRTGSTSEGSPTRGRPLWPPSPTPRPRPPDAGRGRSR